MQTTPAAIALHKTSTIWLRFGEFIACWHMNPAEEMSLTTTQAGHVLHPSTARWWHTGTTQITSVPAGAVYGVLLNWR
jgi:hypothetical protein